MTQLEKTLTSGKIHVSFNALHNKKFQCAVVMIKFNTKYTELLSTLLEKYIIEKVLNEGVNMNNSIYSATSGADSILLLVPENKIFNNISLVFMYLMKTKLNAQCLKKVGNHSYSGLVKDISSFDVTVTGKCKNFIANLSNEGSGKVKNFIKSIEVASSINVNREDGNGSSIDKKEITINSSSVDSNLVALYLSICLGEIPATIKVSNSSVTCTLLSTDGEERLRKILCFKETFQGKVKSFLTQSGSPGSPSSNDTNGSKYKEKCKTILDCENALAECISGVRGFSFKFKDVEALKSVNSNALSLVKSIKM